MLADGSSNGRGAQAQIVLQPIKQSLDLDGKIGRHKLQFVFQLKFRQEGHEVLQRIFFEIAIPRAPLNFGSVEIKVINALNARLAFRIGHGRQTLVTDFG